MWHGCHSKNSCGVILSGLTVYHQKISKLFRFRGAKKGEGGGKGRPDVLHLRKFLEKREEKFYATKIGAESLKFDFVNSDSAIYRNFALFRLFRKKREKDIASKNGLNVTVLVTDV